MCPASLTGLALPRSILRKQILATPKSISAIRTHTPRGEQHTATPLNSSCLSVLSRGELTIKDEKEEENNENRFAICFEPTHPSVQVMVARTCLSFCPVR